MYTYGYTGTYVGSRHKQIWQKMNIKNRFDLFTETVYIAKK